MNHVVSRARLEELFPDGWFADPLRLLALALGDWLIIAACWALMARYPNPLVFSGMTLIVAGRLHALGVVLHDACHRPSRRKTPVMWAVEAVAGWPIGSTIEAMRYHHLRHHRASCTRQDPYRHPVLACGAPARWLMMLRGGILPFWWSLRAFAAPVALLWPAFRNLYAKGFLQDRSGKDLRDDREVFACARADLPQALAHCVAGALIVAGGLPFATFYLLPWVLGGILNGRRVIVEHGHEEVYDTSPATVWRTTRTHGTSWIGRLLLYPHNIGYHQAHHICPTVALEHLPSLHRELGGCAIEAGPLAPFRA